MSIRNNHTLLMPVDTLAYIPRMNIGEILDKAMTEAGFRSQAALARASGVPQPTVNRILKGVASAPETSTLAKLAAACRIPLSRLLGESYDANSPIPKVATQQTAESYSDTPKIHLTYATEEELSILTKYRESTLIGKKLIITACDASEKDHRRIKYLKKS